MIVRPERSADVDVVREVVRAAFGEDHRPTPAYRPDLTGALVYPDVFWRHDAVGLRT